MPIAEVEEKDIQIVDRGFWVSIEMELPREFAYRDRVLEYCRSHGRHERLLIGPKLVDRVIYGPKDVSHLWEIWSFVKDHYQEMSVQVFARGKRLKFEDIRYSNPELWPKDEEVCS
jgi:hypothetical protein